MMEVSSTVSVESDIESISSTTMDESPKQNSFIDGDTYSQESIQAGTKLMEEILRACSNIVDIEDTDNYSVNSIKSSDTIPDTTTTNLSIPNENKVLRDFFNRKTSWSLYKKLLDSYDAWCNSFFTEEYHHSLDSVQVIEHHSTNSISEEKSNSAESSAENSNQENDTPITKAAFLIGFEDVQDLLLTLAHQLKDCLGYDILQSLNTENVGSIELVHISKVYKHVMQWKESRDVANKIILDINDLDQKIMDFVKEARKINIKLQLLALEDEDDPDVEQMLKTKVEDLGKKVTEIAQKMVNKVKEMLISTPWQYDILESSVNIIKGINEKFLPKKNKMVFKIAIPEELIKDLELCIENSTSLEMIRQYIIQKNNWIDRKFDEYTISNEIVKDLNVAFLHGEKVLLQKIDLRKRSQSFTFGILSRLIKLQNRAYCLEFKGSFMVDHNLYIELPYCNCNLFNWVYGCNDYNLMDIMDNENKIPTQPKRNVNEILNILLQLVEAIADLHAIGFEHRELNPEIVFVDENGQLKLIPFGLKDRNPVQYSPNIRKVIFTEAEVQIMNIQDSSSESSTRCRNNVNPISRYTPPRRSISNFGLWDVYSLGVMMFELLCDPTHLNLVPFKGALNESIPEESNYVKGEIRELISSMLVSNPQLRPESHHVAIELKKIITSKRIQSQESLHRQMWRQFNTQTYSQLPGRVNVAHVLAASSDEKNINNSLSASFLSEFHYEVLTNRIYELILEVLFSSQCHVLEYDETIEFYNPSSEILCEYELRAIGRLLYYAVSHGYTCELKFSPLLFCVLSGNIPKTVEDLSEILNCNEDQQHISRKYDDLLSGDTIFKANLTFLDQSFKESMDEETKNKLGSFSWVACKLLCSGPKFLAKATIMNICSHSLQNEAWKQNSNSIQTCEWFKLWLETQETFDLRLFLHFATGCFSLPKDTSQFFIRVYPIASKSIHSNPSCNTVYIGTKFASEESFRREMSHAIHYESV